MHGLIFSSKMYHYERNAGAHRIASFLRSHDADVEVIDFAAHWPLPALKELVKSRMSSKTVFFAFSTFTNHWGQDLNDFTAWLKQTYPHIPIILGGQSVTFTPAENIDYWIDSFGEYAILELLKHLSGNSTEPLKFTPDLSGKLLIKANESYPAYPLESYANILEVRDFVEEYEWLTVELSRGCKFNCTYCNFPILGVKGDYSRSQADFNFEMQRNFDLFGVKNYYIADETFNDRTEKIIKFADAVETLQFKPYFSAFIRPDLVITHRDSWDHLIRMNVGGHFYGVETFNHESAKIIGKGMHPDKVKQGLIEVKSYFTSRLDYRATMGLIVGLPLETRQSILDTFEWLNTYWPDQATFVSPLQIEDINDDNKDGYTNTSKFSKNLIKYGLRKYTGAYDPSMFYKVSTNQFPYLWEHDTMNIIEAVELANMIKQQRTHEINNFKLGQAFYRYKYKDFSQFSHRPPIDKKQRCKEFIDNYVTKKLNLRV